MTAARCFLWAVLVTADADSTTKQFVTIKKIRTNGFNIVTALMEWPLLAEAVQLLTAFMTTPTVTTTVRELKTHFERVEYPLKSEAFVQQYLKGRNSLIRYS